MVGLTGGIGAGKSAVSRRLARRGAVVIDADVLAREVVAPGTPGLAEVVAAFGSGILSPDGALDRPALGALVFGDESARRCLERIIHPRVRARSAELAAAASPGAVVVNDVPLLVETGLAPAYHLVLVVEADPDVRIRRMIETRGLTPAAARARIAAQADDDRRHAAADVLIRNDAGLTDLDTQLERLWQGRLRPYEENVRLRRVAPDASPGRVVEPDPGWPAQAARLAARIRHALGADTVVEHVGATAVPGLPAEDVIGLQVVVPAPEAADGLANALAGIGLPRRPEPPGEFGRPTGQRWHGSADPGRAVDLYVRAAASPQRRAALLLRDYLRAVPQARDRYGAATYRAAQAPMLPGRHAAGPVPSPDEVPWADESTSDDAVAAAWPTAEVWAAETGWSVPSCPAVRLPGDRPRG